MSLRNRNRHTVEIVTCVLRHVANHERRSQIVTRDERESEAIQHVALNYRVVILQSVNYHASDVYRRQLVSNILSRVCVQNGSVGIAYTSFLFTMHNPDTQCSHTHHTE